MMQTEPIPTYSPGLSRLTTEEFNQLSALVFRECGINLPPSKKIMLESRLNKRLRALKIPSFKAYIELITGVGNERSDELIQMINVVTTNKTDFFREPHHFTFMAEHMLPELTRHKRNVKIWSAACSSGEEPYTLAMVMDNFCRTASGVNYDIFGTDISTTILEKAMRAIYPMDKIEGIPPELKKRYLLKSRDLERPTARIVPELRKKVRFGRINLTDATLPVDEMFDIVFCRNVLIYFDRKTQLEVIGKLINNLHPRGYLLIGHSESLHQHNLPIVQVRPTIYQKL